MVIITNHEGTKSRVSIIRYALAVNDTTFMLYTIAAMLVGGIRTIVLLGVGALTMGIML
jgi:hypothetical protein